MDIQRLQEEFGSEDCEIGPDLCGHLIIHIKNKAAAADISLFGAQVLSYTPTGAHDLLWLGKPEEMVQGEAIRGGIPVCWPWFSRNEENPSLPFHGFARISQWNLESITTNDDELTIVSMSLCSSAATKVMWPFDFKAIVQVAIGSSLTVSLTSQNLDSRPFQITSALHTYFAVGDIRQVRIWGLEDVNYIDKLDCMAVHTQDGPIEIKGNVDRIYVDTDQPVIIEDGSLQRSITVTRDGSNSAIVWNPWIKPDVPTDKFPNNGYESMLCVEAGNAASDAQIVQPGQSHTLTTTVQAIEIT